MKPLGFKRFAGMTFLAGSFLGCTEIHPLYVSSFLENLLVTEPSTPLVGTWRERTPLSCDGKKLENETKFGELVFKRGGSFSFTWFPFESFVDCTGTYNYNQETGELSLTVTDGNMPSDSDLKGIARPVEEGYILENISFGTPLNEIPHLFGEAHSKFEKPCGYIIER